MELKLLKPKEKWFSNTEKSELMKKLLMKLTVTEEAKFEKTHEKGFSNGGWGE